MGVPLYLTGGTGSRVLGRDELVGVKDSSVTEMGWGVGQEGREEVLQWGQGPSKHANEISKLLVRDL